MWPFSGLWRDKKMWFWTPKLSFVLLNTRKCPHIPPEGLGTRPTTAWLLYTTISAILAYFGLFCPIFGWIWPFSSALPGCKKVILNSKFLICALKHPQMPPNTPIGVTTTTHDHPDTINYNVCNFGVFWGMSHISPIPWTLPKKWSPEMKKKSDFEL